MYRSHFGLKDRPFELSDDKRFYFGLPHEAAALTLGYSLEQYQGLAMLTGEPGTGKTTLLGRLVEELGPEFRTVRLSDTGVVGGSLTKRFAGRLGIRATMEQLPDLLAERLGEDASNGHTTVLMLDESQDLTHQQLDELLFLSNRFALGNRMLQIFLVGQPSLETRLAEPGLESLNQRVSVRTTVEPLTCEQTSSYISFRLRVAGAVNRHLFTADASALVFERTEGVARLINILCERALAVGYVEGRPVVDRDAVALAIEDLPTALFDPPRPGPIPLPLPRAVSSSDTGGSTEAKGSASADSGSSDRSNAPWRRQLDRVERKLDYLIELLSRGRRKGRRDDTLSFRPFAGSAIASDREAYEDPPQTSERDPLSKKAWP